MKSRFVILILLLSSCHMGKYYAHQRKGGKKTEVEKTLLVEKIILNDSNQFSCSQEVFPIQEIILVDTLSKKNSSSNTSQLKVHSKMKIGTSLPFSYKKKERTVLAEKRINHKIKNKRLRGISTSAMKEMDSYWFKVILAALIIGLLVFLLSNSLGLGILTALLILLAGMVVLAIVTAIVIWLIFELFVLILEGI